MSLLLGPEPFQKFGVGGGWWVGGGQKAFQSSALVQTLDLDLKLGTFKGVSGKCQVCFKSGSRVILDVSEAFSFKRVPRRCQECFKGGLRKC